MNVLDYLNLCYIWCSSYPSLRRTWGSPVLRDGIRVNYGYDRMPQADEQVFGGLVKLQDLNRKFHNCLSEPTILYLVSSALPYFPLRLARMAKKSGAKLVINQNGVAYPGWYGKGWARQNRPMVKLLALSDYVFYQSEFCRISADRFLGRPPYAKGEILFNPVDTGIFYPGRKKQQKNSCVILLSGSHWSPYRVEVAIQVLHQVRKSDARVRLKIAGRFCWHTDPNNAEQEVMAYARELGVLEYIDFVGPYTQEEAPAVLGSSTLLLHTKYNDPCPRLVVEAMACGLPIVYSATGGVPELVGSEAGVGVPGPLDWQEDHPPDAGQLSQAVLKVLDTVDVYAEAARTRAVTCFDVKPWLARHAEVFQNLL